MPLPPPTQPTARTQDELDGPPNPGRTTPTYVLVIRVDGTVETVTHPAELGEIRSLLGGVALGVCTCVQPGPPNGPLAMFVDDNGYANAAAPNLLATALYGGSPIVGDAAITHDERHRPLPAGYVEGVLAAAPFLNV
ncbi:MAG TPA: hypothetical protein VNQ73_02590 [Ilumatobacter sp.]|nr:hypothetical protein [Ilumatobacter sp.]